MTSSQGPTLSRKRARGLRGALRQQPGLLLRIQLLGGGLLCANQLASAKAPPEVVIRERPPLLEQAAHAGSGASSSLPERMLRGAGDTLTDALERVPGLQLQRAGGQADIATASLRGADAKQVPVYLGGVRLNDEVSGTADLSLVPLPMLERVDVYRGNAPITADRLGIGGAIYLHPRRPRSAGARVGLRLGSFGERGAIALGEFGTGSASTLLALDVQGATNDFPFQNDFGQRFVVRERRDRRSNADYTQANAWSTSRYHIGQLKIETVLNAFRREKGVAGLPNSGVDHARSQASRWLAATNIQVPCRSAGGCQLELSTAWLRDGQLLSDPLLELNGRTRLSETSGQRLSQDLRLSVQTAPWLRWTGAVHASYATLDVLRLRVLPHSGSRSVFIGKLGSELDLGTWATVHGLATLTCQTTRGRGERFNRVTYYDGGTCGLLEPTGRLGLTVHATERIEVLANAGRYVRPPSLSELYGISAYVQGNERLEPEAGLSLDLGTRLTETFGPIELAMDAFAFRRTATNLVRYRRSGPQSVTPYNVSRARLLGIDASGSVAAFDHVALSLACTAIDARETTAERRLDPTVNDVLPLTAPLILHTELSFYTRQHQALLDTDYAALALSVHHRSSRFADSAGQVVLPAQDRVDVEFHSDHFKGTLQARLAVRNWLAQRTLDIIGLPLPERSYHASLEAHY